MSTDRRMGGHGIQYSIQYKCKVLRITNKRNQIKADYRMHDQILDTVDTAKYLGVLLNKKLSWKPQVGGCYMQEGK